MDLKEKTVFFEEIVKKKPVHSSIVEKKKFVDPTTAKEMSKNTHIHFTNYIYIEEKKKWEEKDYVDINSSFESLYPYMCTETSPFRLKAGDFLISFELEEKGKKIQAKTIFFNHFDTTNEIIPKLLSENKIM